MKEVRLRPAVTNDALLLFRWRNDVDTMKHSGDQKPFSWLDHKRWFQDTLEDPTRTLLVGESRTGSLPIPVGTVRLDQENDRHTVSITIDPMMRKMGWGHAMLSKLVERCGEIAMIANVRRDNTQSIALFQKCGFKLIDSEDLGWFIESPEFCVLRREPEPTHSLPFRE